MIDALASSISSFSLIILSILISSFTSTGSEISSAALVIPAEVNCQAFHLAWASAGDWG